MTAKITIRMHRVLMLVGAILLAHAPAVSGAVPAEADGVAFFEKRIRPLLAEHCYECHSAAAKKLKGGLRVDSREALLKGGDSGPALVPGNPTKSLLLRAMRIG